MAHLDFLLVVTHAHSSCVLLHRDRTRGLSSIISLFLNDSAKLNNTGARIITFIVP